MNQADFDSRKWHRRSIRLPNYDYSRPGGYFVTIVTFQRACLFGNIVNEVMVLSNLGLAAKQQWEKLPKRFPNVELSTFVVMPNHVHGIIVLDGRGTASRPLFIIILASRRAPTERFGKPTPGSIPTIVRSYKSAVSYRINLLRGAKDVPVWQRNYYEHIIRSEKK